MTRRRRLAIAISVGAGMVIPIAVVAAARIPFSSDTLRTRLVAALEQRLDADVELDSLTLRFHPRLHATGTNLTVRHRGRRDVPPLIYVRRFIVDADLVGLWDRTVDHVKLEGLSIQVPPGIPDSTAGNTTAPSEARTSTDVVAPETDFVKQVVIREIEASDAELAILRRDPTKPRRTWYLHKLRLQSVGVDKMMPFDATVTNSLPPGEIAATGTFGPWQRLDPGETPLDGVFTFHDADLSVFDGIAGTLSAKGSFNGTLNRIDITGETETPDFSVTLSRHAVPLSTTYHAIVDATNGNTTLDPVKARFLDTSLVARGGVYEVKGASGRVVKLDMAMDDGRLEDLMRLAVPTPQAPMTGRLKLLTRFTLPPGRRNVVDKLQLEGSFAIQGGRFTNDEVQNKVNDLSHRASVRARDPESSRAIGSNFSGRFSLGNARLTLPTVSFDVPGALVELSGQYGMKEEDIAFDGNLYMDAKLSQTVGGFKSLLLKIVDPIFRRNGRTVVPLRISGTRNSPQFGVNVGRVFRRGPDSKIATPATVR